MYFPHAVYFILFIFNLSIYFNLLNKFTDCDFGFDDDCKFEKLIRQLTAD